MAITHEGSETASDGSSSTLTVSKPFGAEADDVAVAIATTDDNDGDLALPTGFTQVLYEAIAENDAEIIIGYKVLGDSEPSSYEFSKNDAEDAVASISIFRGVDTENVEDVAHSSQEGDSATPTAASVTTVTDGAVVVAICGCESGGASPFSPPSGMTEIVDVAISGTVTGAAQSAAWETQSSAGATGDKEFTASDSDTWRAALLTLRPGAVFVERTLDDSVEIDDEQGLLRFMPRTIADAIGLDDTMGAVLRSLVRPLGDALGVDDNATYVSSVIRRLRDSADMDDVLLAARQASRALGDALTVADAIGAADTIPRLLVEALAVDDDIGLSFVVALSDALEAVDDQRIAREARRDLVDAVGIEEAVIRGVVVGRHMRDSVSLLDAILASRSLHRDLSDSVELSDILASLRFVLLTDSIETDDNLEREKSLQATLVDDVGILDNLERDKSLYRVIQDSILTNDNISAARQTLIRLSDAIHVADANSSLFAISMSDRLDTDDRESIARFPVRLLPDTIKLDDDQLYIYSVRKILSESISVQDRTSILRVIGRIFSDTIDIDDENFPDLIEFIGLGVFSSVVKVKIVHRMAEEFIVVKMEKF